MQKISDDPFSFAIGILAGLTVLFPLTGRIIGIPAAGPGLLFPAAMVALLPFGRLRVHMGPFIVIGMAAIFCLLVISAAQLEQFAFFLDTSLWLRNDEFYRESKLFMFTLYAVPAGFAAVASGLSPDRNKLIDGILAACVIAASIAMMRTAAQPALFGTDYHIARGWMLTPRGFSETAYGTLFAVGAVAALRWPNGWMFSAGCLLLTAILSRRAETFLILAAMMAAAGWSYFWRHDRARMIKPILAAGCAVIAFAIAHNGHNIRYFSSLWRSAEHRVEMLDEAVATARKLTEQSDKPASFDESAIDPKTVESLGSYAAQSGTGRKYPHNLFLESYIEVGAASAVLFGLIVAFPLTVGTHGTLTGRISYPAFLAIGICATVSLIAIKSGDLTGFGRVAFFPAVAVLATMPPVLQVKRSEHA